MREYTPADAKKFIFDPFEKAVLKDWKKQYKALHPDRGDEAFKQWVAFRCQCLLNDLNSNSVYEDEPVSPPPIQVIKQEEVRVSPMGDAIVKIFNKTTDHDVEVWTPKGIVMYDEDKRRFVVPFLKHSVPTEAWNVLQYKEARGYWRRVL
jgi:hypothetical protein